MVSINTNLSSLMVQSNLTQATNGLNKAIERLSTGYKINHASDNAANYSIANSYESKLSSYEVAASNVQSGLDLLSVAQDTISTMQDHGARLQALITQARNGTYGAQSLTAMTQEAGAIISEIQRMYTNTEYNGINLFEGGGIKFPDWAITLQANAEEALQSFSKELEFQEGEHTVTPPGITMSVTEAVSMGDSYTPLSPYYYLTISSREELELFMSSSNLGTSSIMLANNIDMEGMSWTSKAWVGSFNGNGYIISNLTADSEDFEGLFSSTSGIIENVRLKNVNVKEGDSVGCLVGRNYGIIRNCIVEGTVEGFCNVGGIVGESSTDGKIQNCKFYGTVNGYNSGGIASHSEGNIENCLFYGTLHGVSVVGGIVGENFGTISNCYISGNINGDLEEPYMIGGIAGYSYGMIDNCYVSGNISGYINVGGLCGITVSDVENSISKANVSGKSNVGGAFGGIIGPDSAISLHNLISAGNVTGDDAVGSFAGNISYETSRCRASGSVISTFTPTYNIQDCQVISGININTIGSGGDGKYARNYSEIADITSNPEYNIQTWRNSITELKSDEKETTLQVGIHGDDSSKIDVNTNFEIDLSTILTDIKSDDAYNAITKFMSTLSAKATDLGAISNRLESSLESIAVSMQNLGDSLSTVKDVDMSEVSSEYIKKQILQQASATLLATANQSPAIALQLI